MPQIAGLHLLPARLTRWTSLCVCFELLFSAIAGIPLKMVGFHDGTHTKFLYNGDGQVERVTQYASDSNPLTDNHPRSYTDFDFDSATSDCPRLVSTRTWAEYWTGFNGVPAEVTTYFGVDGEARVLTAPDGTVYKETYAGSADAAWMRGLVKSSEVWSAGGQRKLSTVSWTQDNPGVNYKTNPRVTQTIISDGANVRKTTIDYSIPAYAQFGLPYFLTDIADLSMHSVPAHSTGWLY